MCSLKSISTEPATWLRKPISAYSCLNRIPERPSLNDSVTEAASSPIQDVIPNPVTTTRFILTS